MSGQHFTMRRDTRKHTPPRPAPQPRSASPGPPREPHRGAPDFWRQEDRRHTPRTVPPPPADGRHAR